MTVEQFISDLDELVDAVCERLGKTKVAIFGHSWGSALGVLYAARFPEKVAAYVGSGQIGDWPAAEAASYEFALAEAQRRRQSQGGEEAAGDRPAAVPGRGSVHGAHLAVALRGPDAPSGAVEAGTSRARRAGVLDLRAAQHLRGFRFSMNAMWAEVSRLNLIELAPALQMPVFFFLGRKDHWVPPETSVAYFDALTAPSKKLVWFEHSGHEMFVDEPDKFNAAMTESVRPALPSDPQQARPDGSIAISPSGPQRPTRSGSRHPRPARQWQARASPIAAATAAPLDRCVPFVRDAPGHPGPASRLLAGTCIYVGDGDHQWRRNVPTVCSERRTRRPLLLRER